ncbi:NAD-specific glutamate dehydrogenase [Pseudozyma hubeiensis SY62]|uniref:NAD-specific glutamate dehydrogenase n=1 Tax=Pseudozyma hubeiensis (strain SY62) TaxID=1305764 RepID=R9NVS2_PSEHS|nr:NAD-specific glutamate dehydrogenase [Pseudozyma hubeiensis SY62]GAC92526.1 NAD-specific glutamate dehydrogenase [Pseudozyma hubeiensis SY62]
MRTACMMLSSVFFIALANFAPAAAETKSNTFEKRMVPPELGANRDRVSFQQLSDGKFRGIDDHLPTESSYRPTAHDDKMFYDEKPLFTFKRQDSRLPAATLRQAVADFGGFHARVKGQGHVYTLTPRVENDELIWPYNWDEVSRSLSLMVRRSDWAEGVFGQNVVKLAHGYPVGSVRPGGGLGFPRQLEAPEWTRVHRSEPVSSEWDVPTLRGKLDDYRYLRFLDSYGSYSFGVRALPDGRIEHTLADATRRILH